MVRVLISKKIMNLLIRTGFNKISHSISFQPETTKKEKQLIKAKHVINVKELKENGYGYCIARLELLEKLL